MKREARNLFKAIPDALPDELSETLLDTGKFRIERIVSRGHTTLNGGWYDQDWDEWVIVMQGEAILVFADSEAVPLRVGDYLFIPANVKHRVEWTLPDADTIWLAVHG
jgi:cupin 2 domain-containing protein